MPSNSAFVELTAPRLDAEALLCERDERCLFRELSVTLGPGQALQIEGENGAGKTSLLRILAGLAEANEGQVRWRGLDIRRERASFHQDLLYLGHHSAIKLELTPRENLAFYVGMNQSFEHSALETALQAVGLYGFEDQPARSLSAGQRRRVALARLALSTAPLWILDEPYTALDVAGSAWLSRTLEHHLAGGGLVVLTTHQPLSLAHPLRKLVLQ